jgi:ATP-dependent protease ClpP protease subunit
MAKGNSIFLNGQIHRYGISRDYVNYMLREFSSGPVTVKVSSLGGDLNEAMLIQELFREHGNITVEYLGFCASAATILGHGAVKSVIREDAFFLIHKPMFNIDMWEMMNEDDIQAEIEKMEGAKKDLAKITMTMAKSYAVNRSLDIDAVLTMMKDSRWLTGSEAVEMGLVDEIIPLGKEEPAKVSAEMVAMMSAFGYPAPAADENKPDEKPGMISQILNKITNPKKSKMNTTFTVLNELLSVEGFSEKDGQVLMTADMLSVMSAKITEFNQTIAQLNADVSTAKADLVTAQQSLNEVTASLDEIDPTVASAAEPQAKVVAVKAKMASLPASIPTAVIPSANGGATAADGPDWETINQLPHNQEADRNI